jgi:hypothetical protein
MVVLGRRLFALAMLLPWTPALADDAGLIGNLAALSAAKGSSREFFPEICAALGLPPANCVKGASCSELNDRGADGTSHSFTACRAGAGKEVNAVIGVYGDGSGYIFWSRPDGTMQSALRLEVGPSANRYIPLQPPDQAAQTRFSDELAYWRGRQDALAKAPDRKK